VNITQHAVAVAPDLLDPIRVIEWVLPVLASMGRWCLGRALWLWDIYSAQQGTLGDVIKVARA